MDGPTTGGKTPVNFSVLRVLAIAMPLLVLAAVWVEVTEVYLEAGGLSGGVVSPGAMGLFLLLFVIAAAVPVLRRRWRITRAEIVAVFCILFLSVPIFGAGFYEHFAGLQNEYHRTRDLDRAMSISPDLWPNLGNVLEGVSVEDMPAGGVLWDLPDKATTSIVSEPNGPEKCLRIVHGSDSDVSRVTLELDKSAAARFVEPSVRYAAFAHLRLDAPGASAVATLSAGTDRENLTKIASLRRETEVARLSQTRFVITGTIDYLIPRNTGEKLYVQIVLIGKGTLYAKDVTLIDTEAVYRYLEGYRDASPEVYGALQGADKTNVRYRPSDKWSLAYVRHVLFGLVPWRRWARPLAVWSLMTVGVFLGIFCLVTLFYRQWEEGDRLTFPLQTFVTDLTAGRDRRGPTILRSGAFWAGVGFCTLYVSLQRLKGFFPEVPSLELSLKIDELFPAGPLREALKGLGISVQPLYVAVAFFISMELSFSLVTFYLLGWAYRFLAYFTPLKTLQPATHYEVYPRFPFAPLMMAGGLGCMTCLCVFSARKHLGKVAGKVFLGRGELDDSREALSYRWATFGLLVSAVMLVVFAHLAGLSPTFVLVFLGVYMLMSLSAARIRAEAGIGHTGIMLYMPQQILVAIGGTLVYGFREITFTAQSYFLYWGLFLMCGPILAESMAMATRTGVSLRKLGRCQIAGFLLALVIGGVVTMSWRYTVGALNMNTSRAEKRGFYNRMTFIPYGDDEAIKKYFHDHPDAEPVLTEAARAEVWKPQGVALSIAGGSFLITGLLAAARMIWLGFPLHPLGFALSFTPAMNAVWSSVAVGWAVKSLGLRFGGVQFNRRVLRPFFVGLFVSSLAMGVLWSLVQSLVRSAEVGQAAGG